MRSSVAPIYVALGEKGKAIEELEKAYQVRDPFLIGMNIHFGVVLYEMVAGHLYFEGGTYCPLFIRTK